MSSKKEKTYKEIYHDILKTEFSERSTRNPRYSLRSFAKELEVSPSRISEILSGKQGLSPAYAKKFAQILEFTPPKTEYFIDLVTACHARSQSAREMATIRLKKHSNSIISSVDDDVFKIISDWYHAAIIELTRLKDFRNDYQWIAQSLRITPIEAEMAIKRLIRRGLLERQGDKLLSTENVFKVDVKLQTSNSVKKYQHQILKKTITSLFDEGTDNQTFASAMIVTDQKGVKILDGMIKEFFKEAVSRINNEPDLQPNRVYCLNTQFVKMSHFDSD